MKKFKKLSWDASNTENLGNVINTVIGSLSQKSLIPSIGVSGSILSTISSLIGGGTIFLGSAAIWLMSDALQKFKDLKWENTDSVLLGDVINTVIGSLKK